MNFKLTILPFLATLMIEYVLCGPGRRSLVVSSDEALGNKEGTQSVTNELPVIYEMNVNSNISNRFAKTLIESKVKNPQTTSREATFSVVLPEKAFISEFVMEIGGKSYKAYVKEKEEAKNIYDKAVSSGQSAAHVAVSARDSNRFTVSINIEPEAKAAFLLTYEELLERKSNQYELVLNIHPGQIVKDLNVQVSINESRPLLFVKTPSLRSGNEISKNENKADPHSLIDIVNKTSATIEFNPDGDEQKEFAKQLGGKESEGLAGQFIVQYDVERDPHGGEVLLQDGYFVHFFAPKDAEPLPKNVFFILDTSGSMSGTKMKQLKDAMISILGEIKPDDTLSIIEFSSETLVWNIEAESSLKISLSNYSDPFPELSKQDMPGPVAATKEIIEKAKKLVTDKLQASGGTYMIGGLEAGLYMVKTEMERYSNTDKKQPIIIFLTDGEPNVGTYSTEEITNHVTRLNNNGINVPIFSLSFGEGADKAFLRKLSLKNLGFSRHIYDAADAYLQLQDFYKQISSPLLSNVNFKYDSEVKELTKTIYPILFDGGELVIAGRYTDPKLSPEIHAIGRRGPVILRPKIEIPVTSLERLWAYLTVKETLEKRDAADNKTELTKKALDLALKYSFVTDVSSLVVVKPNATDNAVNTEDASKPKPSYSGSYGHPGVFPRMGGAAYSNHITHHAFASSARSSSHSYSNRMAFLKPMREYPASIHVAAPPTTSYDLVGPSSSAVFSSTAHNVPQKLEDSLTWLPLVLQANRTLSVSQGVFELGDMSLTVPVGAQCPKTPEGKEGHCTLIKDCPEVFSLLTDFDTYKQFFCPMQNKYAGVCCPK